jgi:aspartate ammonia-lyase
MKESKIIELKNKVQGLTKVVKNLIQEVHSCISMSQGTLTALQLHLGKEEWDKIVEELKEREKRLKDVEQSMEKGS